MSLPKHPFVSLSLALLPLSSSFFSLALRSLAPSLIIPPCPSSPFSSGPCMCHSVSPGGRFVWAAEEGLPSGGADPVWKSSASVIHAVFPAGTPVHPARSGRGSRHPCMWVRDLCDFMWHWPHLPTLRIYKISTNHWLLPFWQAPSYLSNWPRATSEASPCISSLCPMEGAAF